MMLQRKTAAKYLEKIVDTGLLQKVKMGTSNYYVNIKLMELLANVNVPEIAICKLYKIDDQINGH